MTINEYTKQLWDNHDMTSTQIAKVLNKAGVRTARGKKVTARQVKTVGYGRPIKAWSVEMLTTPTEAENLNGNSSETFTEEDLICMLHHVLEVPKLSVTNKLRIMFELAGSVK